MTLIRFEFANSGAAGGSLEALNALSEEGKGGLVGSVTLSEGWSVTVWSHNPSEYAPGEWLHLVPHLNNGDSPGVSIAAGNADPAGPGESIFVEKFGRRNAAMTVINDGTGTADLTINWRSSSSEG